MTGPVSIREFSRKGRNGYAIWIVEAFDGGQKFIQAVCPDEDNAARYAMRLVDRILMEAAQ